jgi:hypothetical protein
LNGSNEGRNYATRGGAAAKAPRLAALALLVTACGSVAFGCGENSPSAITALDGSFSNQGVEASCLSDLDHVAEVAAEQSGTFTFFAYDGDPLSRRGISVDFGDTDIPNRYKGTEKESQVRVDGAKSVLDEMQELAAERPQVGETPLVGVLTRIARIAGESPDPPKYVVNCGDGIWTDLDPEMSDDQIQELAQKIPSGLEGVKVDFIGLGASDPGTGEWIESLRSVVERILRAKHAELGVYDIELPAAWPES